MRKTPSEHHSALICHIYHAYNLYALSKLCLQCVKVVTLRPQGLLCLIYKPRYRGILYLGSVLLVIKWRFWEEKGGVRLLEHVRLLEGIR